MKKHIIYLLVSVFTLLSNMALISCSDDDVADANDVLVVKSVLPIKVMEGQVVTIAGTGLEKATSVVFPGNVSVNNITKVGNGYISVITPAGISAEGGTVTIEADGESAESVMALTVGKP
ncbi:IPT/TIG domain-containing protein [Bacteroides fluxus]|uniref:Conserved domain protein n=2 Tax=Bacteroides fluxus TaxID=626930 RepID=F3PTZ0_9BACE|nr:IPT/TIG domain-containing protein [Bacteroides fluxus]EGF56435.1 conserved domain protein [Bacteroides fluxus YIT 12057]